jgi:hypothetical protein
MYFYPLFFKSHKYVWACMDRQPRSGPYMSSLLRRDDTIRMPLWLFGQVEITFFRTCQQFNSTNARYCWVFFKPQVEIHKFMALYLFYLANEFHKFTTKGNCFLLANKEI